MVGRVVGRIGSVYGMEMDGWKGGKNVKNEGGRGEERRRRVKKEGTRDGGRNSANQIAV